jgi:glycosyltransferase involved in cell wall biosynthesis
MEQFEKGLVSIIIPVFNRASLLPETLYSIVSQTYVNWECIIVDDGSTDSSLNVALGYARKDNRFKVYSRPWYKKKGANSCRNYGFQLSKGEFIQWFDSDDLMMKHHLSKKVESLSLTKSDLVICKSFYFYKDSESNKLFSNNLFNNNSKNLAFDYFANNCWFGTPQAMLKKNILLEHSYIFNNRLTRNQETELFVRILLKNVKLELLDLVLVSIRIHDFSISGKYSLLSTPKKMIEDIEAYFSLYLHFKRENKITDEIDKYFGAFFFRSLKKMNSQSIQYFKLLFFGLKNNLFPSKVLAIKIFIFRNFKLFFHN